ncbi:MAG: InlB B-repeat-containing protein [Firmicutes bacterium]|nr:InlB B-repeat-containing protein [Bacillota bacterium]
MYRSIRKHWKATAIIALGMAALVMALLPVDFSSAAKVKGPASKGFSDSGSATRYIYAWAEGSVKTNNAAKYQYQLDYGIYINKDWASGDYSVTVSGGGVTKATKKYSGALTGGAYKKLGSATASEYSKTKQAVTKTITITAKKTSGKGSGATSTLNLSYTIPALESYPVRYYANGGSGAPAAAVKWYGENLTLSAVKPTRSGYKFLGWYTNAAGTGTKYNPGQVYGTNAALNLYAKWEEMLYDMTAAETVSGVDFRTFTADSGGNASLGFSLGNNAYVVFPGLDKGADYTVTENSSGKYTPSYTVSEGAEQMTRPSASAAKGEALSTDAQTLTTDTTVDYRNERTPPEGVSVTLKKKLMGDQITDADRNRLFSFSYVLQGLDPEETYTINMENATDDSGEGAENITIPVTASGTASGTVSFHGGESAVIENLPVGARFAAGENLSNFTVLSGKTDYTAVCEVTDGAEYTDTDYKFYTPEELAGLKSSGVTAIGTQTITGGTASGYELIQDGAEVEYTFTNAKYILRNFTLKKVVTEDGEPAASGEKFDVEVTLAGLQKNATYQSSAGNLTSDENGKLTRKIALGHNETFVINSLPGTARFEVVEQGGSYQPSIEVKAGAETVLEETGEYGKEFEVSFEDMKDDLTATLQNEKPKHANLTITKEFDGLFNENTVSAHFRIEFTDLAAGETYQVRKKNADGDVFDSDTITASGEGTAVYSNSLKTTQTMEILKLPTASKYRITEGAQAGVIPTYVLTSDKANIKVQGGSAEKGQALSTETEVMTVDRDYSFYNDIPGDPHKTVSDGDGLTKYGDGDEIEVSENYVPKKSGNWVYHISEKLDVPVRKYVLFDDLPPYVRTTVRDQTADGESAPFRVYWTSGQTRHGGAITEYNEDTGEYFVKEGSKTLFSIIYDDQSDIQAHLEVTMEDEELLLEGDGQFDLYFKAFLDKDATDNDLVAADCYDGEYFAFDNQASRLAGSYMSETENVTTLIPGENGLKVKKFVTSLDGLKAAGDTFRFEAALSGLEGGKTYTYTKTNRISAGLVAGSDGKTSVEAVDSEGKTHKDVSVQILDEDEEVIANIRAKTAVRVPAGEYTAVFSYDGTQKRSALEIEDAGGTLIAHCEGAQFFAAGGETSYAADRYGKAEVSFALSDGQIVTFAGLPDDCQYNVTEDAAANYQAAYAYTQGASGVIKASDDAGEVNKALSTGKNTFREGRDTTVVYSNTKDDPKLKIIKVNEDGDKVAGASMVLYSGKHDAGEIEKGTTHFEGIPDAPEMLTWTTGSNGEMPEDPARGIENGYITLPPGEYTLAELDAPENQGLEVAQPVYFRVNADGTYNVWNAETNRYGADQNTTVELRMVDPYLIATDLFIKKIVTGDLGDLTKQFEFTIELSGLRAGEEVSTTNDPGIETSKVVKYTADASGKATIRIKLRGGEEKVIPAIPYGATYKVTEAASDHVASYTIAAEDGGATIAKDRDTNGNLSAKALVTQVETVELHEDLVHVVYRNNRDLATTTAVPGYYRYYAVALLILLAALALLLWRRHSLKPAVRNESEI